MTSRTESEKGRTPLVNRRSLASEVADVLRQEIAAGRWADVLPGERQLTELLQVSRTSLRPALKQLEWEGVLHSSHGRRRKVIGAKSIREPAVRGLIAFISPLPLERIEPFVLLQLEHLRTRLAQKQMTFKIETRPSCFSGRPDRSLQLLVKEVGADVWVLWRSSREMQQWFIKNNLRHVVLGTSYDPHVPYVDLDHHATGHHAATAFARLGHRRAAILVQDSGLAGDAAMMSGFQIGANQGPVPMQVDFVRHDGSPESIVRSVDRLLTFSPRPTGLLSAGGTHTICAITRLLEKGVRIPDDVSVISRDDDPTLDYMNPKPARYHRSPLKFAVGVIRQIGQLFPLVKPTSGILIFPTFQSCATLAPPPKICLNGI